MCVTNSILQEEIMNMRERRNTGIIRGEMERWKCCKYSDRD